MRLADLLFERGDLLVQRAPPGGEERLLARQVLGRIRLPCEIRGRS